MNKLERDYFSWLCSKVLDQQSNIKYNILMSYLYDYIFIPVIDMDTNRAEDGKALRRRFEIEENIPRDLIISTFSTRSNCSILEMMIALAIRCEESIMSDEEYGDRTGLWFWNMIASLGLGTMNDSRFDEHYVSIVLDRFINRQYKRNGEGGLFTIDGIKRDMRNVEIWYQMNWYLDNL
jgi:hypothetical protein